MSGRIVFVGGGVRCGKSAFALSRARALGEVRLFIATAQARDDEMRERAERHQRERGTAFETIEEPLALAEVLALHAARADVIVVDCLTLWLSNLLLRDQPSASIAGEFDAFAGVLAKRRCHVVMVSNEVGMGLVPDTALGRRFRDEAGRLHQRMAALSDEIYFGMLGSLLRLRPEPLSLQITESPVSEGRDPHAAHH